MLDKYDNWRLLEQFFKKPTYSYHLREICRMMHWSPTKVRLLTNALKKEGLIVETREKNLSMFKGNKEAQKFKNLKIIYNLQNALDMANYLEEKLGFFDAIIFFGSASKGEDSEKSDFDICVIGQEEDVNFEKFEKKLNRKISLLFVENIEELKRKNPEFLNNLINGFVLKGYLKVLK